MKPKVHSLALDTEVLSCNEWYSYQPSSKIKCPLCQMSLSPVLPVVRRNGQRRIPLVHPWTNRDPVIDARCLAPTRGVVTDTCVGC